MGCLRSFYIIHPPQCDPARADQTLAYVQIASYLNYQYGCLSSSSVLIHKSLKALAKDQTVNALHLSSTGKHFALHPACSC